MGAMESSPELAGQGVLVIGAVIEVTGGSHLI
jgi:hypothetical protein